MRIMYNNLRKLKKDKKKHGLQISGRMKLRHTILKGDSKPCPRNCTAERGSNQGTNQGIGPQQRRENSERAAGKGVSVFNAGGQIRAQRGPMEFTVAGAYFRSAAPSTRSARS